jgi:hypothetical protein
MSKTVKTQTVTTEKTAGSKPTSTTIKTTKSSTKTTVKTTVKTTSLINPKKVSP